MRETLELRVLDDDAKRHLPKGLGATVGFVRRIELATDDPLLLRIGELQDRYRTEGRSFFYGWEFRRRYTSRELTSAKVIYIYPKRTFEPAGEECGTRYDDTISCKEIIEPEHYYDSGQGATHVEASTCGYGSRQVTPLYLDGRRIPKSVDIARTISGEIVVSAKWASVFRENNLTGAEYGPIRLSNSDGKVSKEHYQLIRCMSKVQIASSTRAGEGPFDTRRFGRCPVGHVLGLNLLSEVTIYTDGGPMDDLVESKEMFGLHRGLLRPRPILLLSARGWQALRAAKLNGINTEVAHTSAAPQ